MKCYNCGHLLPEDSEFCQYCGKRIENEISIQENTVEEVVLSNNVIAVSDYAFSTFKRLENVEYSDNLMTIGAYAFADSTGVYDSFTVKENVREVKYSAFSGTVIDEIIIEDGVKSIESKAFYKCSNITKVTSLIPAKKLFEIETNIFYGINYTSCTLYVPYGAKEKYSSKCLTKADY